MRPRLLDRKRERPRERRGHAPAPTRTAEPLAPRADPEQVVASTAPAIDADAERVRQAGGPLDQAVYSCSCGYVFSAPVCTTVACPHCGGGQAW